MTEIKYISFDTIDSTNKYAKELVQKDVNLALGTVVTAKTQTAGKGRLGRSFYSPKDCGIYMSAILVPQYKITNPALITCITAVVVKNVLCDFFNIQDDLKIKWVNDLYLGNKKNLRDSYRRPVWNKRKKHSITNRKCNNRNWNKYFFFGFSIGNQK